MDCYVRIRSMLDLQERFGVDRVSSKMEAGAANGSWRLGIVPLGRIKTRGAGEMRWRN